MRYRSDEECDEVNEGEARWYTANARFVIGSYKRKLDTVGHYTGRCNSMSVASRSIVSPTIFVVPLRNPRRAQLRKDLSKIHTVV